MSLIKQTDQVTQAIALLLTQFQGKPKIEALLTAFINQVQDLENAFFDLYLLRSLDAATGLQLDGIGKIVNLVRDGRNDIDYRLALRVQVLINKTSCTIAEIVNIAKLMVADTYQVYVQSLGDNATPGTDLGPVDVDITFSADIGDTPTPIVVARVLRRIVAAGVRANISWDDVNVGLAQEAFSLGPDPDIDGHSTGLDTGGFIRGSDGVTKETLI